MRIDMGDNAKELLPPGKDSPAMQLIAKYITVKAAKEAAKDVRQHEGDGLRHLREWREYCGLSVIEAAKKIGCSPMIIRNWEGRVRNWPKSLWLPAIAAAFCCTIEDLYFAPPGYKE